MENIRYQLQVEWHHFDEWWSSNYPVINKHRRGNLQLFSQKIMRIGYEGLVFHCHIFPCSLGLISLLTTLQIMIQATFTIKFAKNRSKSQELPRNCRFSRPLVHLRARFPHFSPKSPIPPQPSARANSPRPVPPSSAAAGRWPRWRRWPRGLKETPTSSCCPGHWVAPASGGVWRCCLDLILENSNRNSWLSSEIHLGDMGSIENLG